MRRCLVFFYVGECLFDLFVVYFHFGDDVLDVFVLFCSVLFD